MVDQGGGPYRVLYAGGRPNWEFKFLRRALQEDEQVNLVGLLRIAKRQAKFEFQAAGSRKTSPLYNGFDADPDTAEAADQPVLVRLGTEDEVELRDGFPKTAEELYRYHAIVIDDLEASFFTQDQLALLRNFVSRRGGGLLMLGGPDSFSDGKYDRTPVGEMLPVYLTKLGPHPPDSGRGRLPAGPHPRGLAPALGPDPQDRGRGEPAAGLDERVPDAQRRSATSSRGRPSSPRSSTARAPCTPPWWPSRSARGTSRP